MAQGGAEAAPSPPPARVQVFILDSLVKDAVVRNTAGDDLGHIRDLLLDLAEARIVAAVLTTARYLGLGGKYYVIPWDAFEKRSADNVYILDIPKEKLARAPTFDINWTENITSDYLNMIFGYYGYRPYWEESRVNLLPST